MQFVTLLVDIKRMDSVIPAFSVITHDVLGSWNETGPQSLLSLAPFEKIKDVSVGKLKLALDTLNQKIKFVFRRRKQRILSTKGSQNLLADLL